MSRYGFLIGKRVEAHYRTGEIHLSAVGTLVSDSGKSVFIEERYDGSGKSKLIRVEIPYEYILRIAEIEESGS